MSAAQCPSGRRRDRCCTRIPQLDPVGAHTVLLYICEPKSDGRPVCDHLRCLQHASGGSRHCWHVSLAGDMHTERLSEPTGYHPLRKMSCIAMRLGCSSSESSSPKTQICYHLGIPHCIQYSSDPNLRVADDGAGAPTGATRNLASHASQSHVTSH